jgi:hypothetical protein
MITIQENLMMKSLITRSRKRFSGFAGSNLEHGNNETISRDVEIFEDAARHCYEEDDWIECSAL